MAVLPLLTISCVKEEMEAGRQERPGEMASIVATLEPATKADIDGVDGSFTWNSGDQFGVWCATGTVAGVVGGVYDQATLKSGEGTDEAVFTVNLSGYRDRFAIFPWRDREASHTGGGDGLPLYINLPATYSNLSTTPMPMVAENMAGEKLEFRHVGALLRLTLKNLPPSVKHIKVDTGENITGTFEVDTLSKTEPLISVDSPAGSNGQTITYSFSSALPTGGDVTLDVPLPTGLHYNLTVAFYYGGGSYSEFQGRVQRGDVRFFSRASGKAVTIDLPGTVAELRKSMRVFSLNDPGNINIDKTVTMGYSATKGRDSYYDYYEDAISANDGLTINAWSLDPSGEPHDAGAGRRLARGLSEDVEELHAARGRQLHEQPGAACRVDDVPVTADHYEWEITESIGAADATLTPNGSTAILKAGRQGGLVRYVCRATMGGITQATTPRTIQIVRHPTGTLPGSFTISSDLSKEPAFFSTGNLMRDNANMRYMFESPQYMIYSGVYEATNNLNPYQNNYWDLFIRGVVDLFKDNVSDEVVYVNENYPETIGWFTLNYTQWTYLMNTRKAATVCGTANARYVFGRVGSVNGLILFPDDYVHPEERILLRNINIKSACSNNVLTKEEFMLMETAGAVFLPLSGYCDNTSYRERNGTAIYVYYYNASRTIGFSFNSNGGWSVYGDTSTNLYNPIRLVHF